MVLKELICNRFYYNKIDITPTVLDSGNEIILANWPNNKHIICNIKVVYLPVPLEGNRFYYVPCCGGWPHGRAHVCMIVLQRHKCMGT